MAERKHYVAVAEVHFHLGELYFLIPFFHAIRWQPGERICLLFTSRKLYREYLADPLLVRAMSRLPIDIELLFLRKHARLGPALSLVREVYRTALRPARRRRILRLMAKAEYYFAQIAGGLSESIMRPRDVLPAPIVRFPHTSSAQIINVEEAKKQTFPQIAPGEPLMLSDPDAIPYYELWGMQRAVILGYGSLTPEWHELVDELAPELPEHAVVFTIMPRDDMLPRAKWETLHRSTYETIRRVFPDVLILFKPHPNQDIEELREFIDAQGWHDVRIVSDNPMLIAPGALFSVGYLTGGIYNTMLLDIPSISYFNAREEYVAAVGSFMVAYATLGAPQVETEQDFERELRRIASGDLTIRYGAQRRAIPVVRSVAELRARIGEPPSK